MQPPVPPSAAQMLLPHLLPGFSHDLAPNSGSLEKEFIFSSRVPLQGLIELFLFPSHCLFLTIKVIVINC